MYVVTVSPPSDPNHVTGRKLKSITPGLSLWVPKQTENHNGLGLATSTERRQGPAVAATMGTHVEKA